MPPSRDELARARGLAALLSPWFAEHGREFPWRHWNDVYRVVVVEVLLQRTRAQHVAGFSAGFFRLYPSWEALRQASLTELELALTPVGLQRRRASTLLALAETVRANPNEKWDSRPGIGQYVSRAIAVSLDNDPVAMVDSNFVRMIKRVFDGPWLADYRSDDRLQSLAEAVIAGSQDARVANWAVLDLGATTCLPSRPRCPDCPIQQHCLTGDPGASGRPGSDEVPQ